MSRAWSEPESAGPAARIHQVGGTMTPGPIPLGLPGGAQQLLALQRAVGNLAVLRAAQPRTSPHGSILREPIQREPILLQRQPLKTPPVSKDPLEGGSTKDPNASTADGPQPKAPTPTDPGSGIDWDTEAWSAQDFYNRSRMVLEVTRPIPVVGLLTGAVADTVVIFQDLDTLRNEPSSYTEKVMLLRNVVNLINNAVGSLASLDIWVQDAAAASVVGTVVTPVTAGILEGIKGVKIVLDGIEIFLDVVVAAGAAYNASHAPTKESHDRWNSVLANYEANLLGDVLTGVFDIADAVSAGTAQGENVKGITKAFWILGQAAKGPLKEAIRSVLLGWFGIYGSGAMPTSFTGPGPAAATPPTGGGASVQTIGDADSAAVARAAKRAGIGVVRGELRSMRTLYTGMDTALTSGSDVMSQLMSKQREQLTHLLGGQDPLKLFVTKVSEGMTKVNNEVTALRKVQLVARTAKERSDWLIGMCKGATASLESIKVPQVSVPKAGGGGVLDAASDLLQKQVVGRVLGQLNGMVNSAKSTALNPIRTLQAHAGEIAEFSVILQETAGRSVTSLQARVASMAKGLARCKSLEDIFNLMIKQAFEALGAGEGFTVADVIAGWKSIGPMLDDADALMGRVESSLAAAPVAAPAASGPVMAMPEPPTD